MRTMPEAKKEATHTHTHTLFQRDAKMRIRDIVHWPAVCDLTNAYDNNAKAFRSDSKGGTVSNKHV